MTSVASFFAPPTATPLALYTSGLTGMDPARPALSTAFEWFLRRILAFTTGFKWLSLGNFSRRTLKLPATPTSDYYLEPTKTVIMTTVNHSLAISVMSVFAFFVSLLFGAGVVYFGRRGGSSVSPSTVYHQKAKNLKSSLYAEPPTLCRQDDTVLPDMPRLSSFWISALSFVLRGLAFLFRLIAVEKLLDVVEDNAADHETATSTDSHMAESQVLDRRLVRAMNFTTPTQTGGSPACLSDANKTLVAPFTPYAKSKFGQVFLPSSDDKVDVILLPKEIKAYPPNCIDIDPTSSRKATISPAVADIFGKIFPLPVVHAGATPEGSDVVIASPPASSRRSSFRIRPTHAPLSVEPSCVPDTPLPTPSPVNKSSYRPFRRTHPTSGDRPSTPPRNNTSVTPSVEPSARVVTLESRSESSSKAAGARVNRPNGFTQEEIDARLKATRERLTLGKLLSSRLSTGGEANPRLSRFTSTRSTGAEADRPPLNQTEPGSKNTNAAATDPNLTESVAEVRERARRTIERAREAAEATDLRIRTKFPKREQPPLHRPKPKSTDTDPQTVNQETPRDKAREAMAEMRQRHEDLFARVHAALKRCDERRELWAKARSHDVQTGPGRARPESTLFSKYPKYRSLTDSEEVGLDSHRAQPSPDRSTVEQNTSSADSTWRPQDHIPETTDESASAC